MLSLVSLEAGVGEPDLLITNSVVYSRLAGVDV